jgi:hypothetical protein
MVDLQRVLNNARATNSLTAENHNQCCCAWKDTISYRSEILSTTISHQCKRFKELSPQCGRYRKIGSPRMR